MEENPDARRSTGQNQLVGTQYYEGISAAPLKANCQCNNKGRKALSPAFILRGYFIHGPLF